MHLISDLGCTPLLDNGTLQGKVYATKILELIGAKTIKDSLRCLYRDGLCCNTGILGGVYFLNGFDMIKDIPNGVYLTSFFSNYPTQKIIDDIFAFIDQYHLKPYIGASFAFKDIKKAIKAQERGVDGKIIVVNTEAF
jgi:NADPH:quinone reductase-like Zn-dependent oxidoreductase